MNESQPQPNDTAAAKRGLPAVVLVVVALAVAAFAVLRMLNPRGDSGGNGPAIGHRLPKLSLAPLTGDARPVELGDLAGHVTLLDFWGTWCPPCREELPHLAAIGAKYGSRGDFLFLPVSCGAEMPENVNVLRHETDRYLLDEKLKLATYADPDGTSRLGVDMVTSFQGYPTTLVLDRQGVIRGFWVGYRRGEERQIEQRLVEVLGERKQ